MNLLSIEHLSKSYSRRQLFDDTSFFLQEGEKVGIIGINGTGKSTLLKIMAGLEETDEGTVTKANHAVIAYLPQHPVFDPEMTALDCVLAGHRELSGPESGQAEKRDHQDEAALVTKAKTMLTKLGVSSFDQKSGELSGGQRKRLALVSVLLKEADILLLDEPTNHLDHEMADWLEEQLKQRKEALVMITHDRYFLDSVCNRIAEVDKGKLYSYDTNYAGYLELKAQREEMAQATELKRQNILRTELAWVQRGARARSTKQKARLERYEELKNRNAPETDGQVELGSISTRLGRTTLEARHVEKGYGDRILIHDFSYIFLKNDRVAFIGASVSAAKMLERFLFEGSEQYTEIGRLSGGEKRRLNLLRVLMGAPNVLILDEPTNDLDITTLTVLEDYLDHFEGIVIIVSHDRYFLDRTVSRIFAFEEGGHLQQYEGNYSDYALRKSMETQEFDSITEAGNGGRKETSGERGESARATWKKPARKLKFTYQEQKDYDTIEQEMADLEDLVCRLDEDILKAATDFVRLNELSKQKEEASAKLEEKMERWMYLEEKAARIEAGELEENTENE